MLLLPNNFPVRFSFSFVVFATWSCFFVSAETTQIDSLKKILATTAEDTVRVNVLNELAFRYPYVNPDEGIRCGRQALELSVKLNWQPGIAAAHHAIGSNYVNKADYANALKEDFEALKMYDKAGNKRKQALLLRNVGIVFHTSRNQPKALEYDNKALSLYRELGDSAGVAAMYNNMANVYYTLKDTVKVLEYDFKALHLFEELKDEAGIARMLGNIANLFAEYGKFSQAMPYYFDALRRETALGNRNGITRNMGNIGQTYYDIARADDAASQPDSLIPAGKFANLRKAIEFLEATIQQAKAMQQMEYVLAFAEVLSDAYALSGRPKEALSVYRDYIVVRDSIYDEEKINEANRRELDYEYGKREDSLTYEKRLTEAHFVDEQRMRKKERFYYGAGLLLVIVFSGFMFNRWRVTQLQKQIIEAEKQRSDELLLNILPEETAAELKAKGNADAKSFDEVTVMFTDFKNFSAMSEKLTAQELVNEINYCYSAFDRIIGKHRIEKIKTIGDSYMCAGGLPVENRSNAVDIVRAALEIRDFMQEEMQKRKADGRPFFEIRIGCHTGPVVAGIVGIKKFAYDIWGDTVNIASRMESSGEPGKVNISGSTYGLVKSEFRCHYRGKIEAKNKGEVDMYFVETNEKRIQTN